MQIAELIDMVTENNQNANQYEIQYKLLKQLYHEILHWVFF